MKMYLIYAAMFFLGQLLHLLAIKIPSLKSKADTNNKAFSLRRWWQEDWNIILATNVIGTMLLIGLDQILHWKPEIENVVKWFFAGVGAFGSSLAMRFSKYEAKLMHFLDIKANIADKAVGHTKNLDDLIEKGNVLTGSNVESAPKKYDA